MSFPLPSGEGDRGRGSGPYHNAIVPEADALVRRITPSVLRTAPPKRGSSVSNSWSIARYAKASSASLRVSQSPPSPPGRGTGRGALAPYHNAIVPEAGALVRRITPSRPAPPKRGSKFFGFYGCPERSNARTRALRWSKFLGFYGCAGSNAIPRSNDSPATPATSRITMKLPKVPLANPAGTSEHHLL